MTQSQGASASPLSARRMLSVKPREARVTVSRVLRQADWDWGLEPAVTSVVLAAHLKGLEGFVSLQRDWEQIRTSRPESNSAVVTSSSAFVLACPECHAVVAAPSVLDHLVTGALEHGSTQVTIEGCSAPEMLEALVFFAPRYGISITARVAGDTVWLSAARDDPPARTTPTFSALQKADYWVDAQTWERLRSRSQDYLVPESEVSRSHAGDGTRSFPFASPVSAATNPADGADG